MQQFTGIKITACQKWYEFIYNNKAFPWLTFFQVLSKIIIIIIRSGSFKNVRKGQVTSEDWYIWWHTKNLKSENLKGRSDCIQLFSCILEWHSAEQFIRCHFSSFIFSLTLFHNICLLASKLLRLKVDVAFLNCNISQT